MSISPPDELQAHLEYFEWFKTTFLAVPDYTYRLVHAPVGYRIGVALNHHTGVQLFYKLIGKYWSPSTIQIPLKNPNGKTWDLFELTEQWALYKRSFFVEAKVEDDFRHHVLFTALLDYPPFRRS